MNTKAELARALELLRGVDDPECAIAEFLKEMESPIVKISRDDWSESPREWDNSCVMYCVERHHRDRYDIGDKDADPPWEEREGVYLDNLFVDRGDFDYILDALEENGTPKIIMEDVEEAFEDWDTHKIRREDIAIISSLYLYDHIGITIRMGKFSCPWDSGQVGVIYMTKKSLEDNFNGDLEAAQKGMEGEVKMYDHFIQGNVWSYTIEDHTGDEIDSCSGFFGDDLDETGMKDSVEKQYRELFEAAWENRS